MSERACKHTPEPSGYVAWHEWAEKKAKTHVQQQCPVCGLWKIWRRKKQPAGEVSGGD